MYIYNQTTNIKRKEERSFFLPLVKFQWRDKLKLSIITIKITTTYTSHTSPQDRPYP